MRRSPRWPQLTALAAADRVACSPRIARRSNLVGLLCPLAARIIGTPASFPDPALRVTAASALCAFMCVSEQFCGEQLQVRGERGSLVRRA